jgi:hypothetical protein
MLVEAHSSYCHGHHSLIIDDRARGRRAMERSVENGMSENPSIKKLLAAFPLGGDMFGGTLGQ